MSKQLEIAKVLVCSTAHVTRDEGLKLSLNGFSREEYGWFIFVPPRGYGMTIFGVSSEGFRRIIDVARANGCRYVLFDRDADYIEGVETYDW